MSVTRNVAEYTKNKCINLAELSNRSGVPYPALHASLGKNGTRELRANELLDICDVMNVDPMSFRDSAKEE